jgi:4'-phosphopantetheinyl transferase
MSPEFLASGRGGDDDDRRAPIRVWRAELDRPEPETSALRALLSADECERADRFRFERDRKRFTVARGLLRCVLGRMLGVAAPAIAFAYAPRGKPGLKDPDGSGLEFNLSHSNGVGLIATSWGRRIGVDLEFGRPDLDFLGIADRFFTPREFGEIRAQPRAMQRSAFFRGWARKEAFLKARGDGLWLGLDQFEVSIDPASPARVVHTAWDLDEARRWTLHDLDAPAGFAAALAVEGALTAPVVVEVLGSDVLTQTPGIS